MDKASTSPITLPGTTREMKVAVNLVWCVNKRRVLPCSGDETIPFQDLWISSHEPFEVQFIIGTKQWQNIEMNNWNKGQIWGQWLTNDTKLAQDSKNKRHSTLTNQNHLWRRSTILLLLGLYMSNEISCRQRQMSSGTDTRENTDRQMDKSYVELTNDSLTEWCVALI